MQPLQKEEIMHKLPRTCYNVLALESRDCYRMEDISFITHTTKHNCSYFIL